MYIPVDLQNIVMKYAWEGLGKHEGRGWLLLMKIDIPVAIEVRAKIPCELMETNICMWVKTEDCGNQTVWCPNPFRSDCGFRPFYGVLKQSPLCLSFVRFLRPSAFTKMKTYRRCMNRWLTKTEKNFVDWNKLLYKLKALTPYDQKYELYTTNYPQLRRLIQVLSIAEPLSLFSLTYLSSSVPSYAFS